MLKKFLIGSIAVFALAFALNVSAAVDLGPTTLKVGSSGQYVMNLQTVVGATADGKFGPMTKAKVMAWQSNNGLVADGLVGPATKNAMNAGSFTGTTATTCPVGQFDPMTGLACGAVSTLPAGCLAGYAFSSTTGAACVAGTTTTTTTTSGLEGSVAVSYAPVPANNTSVDKGSSKNVMALEVKASGSDMNVNRVWLDINTRIWLSASEVALLDGSTILATIPLSASTVTEVTAGSAWRLEFNGLNITVPVNTTKTLTFRVTRPELTSANANVTVANTSTIRTTDGAGYSETTTLTQRIWVMSSSTATVGSMTGTLSSTSPKAQSVSGLSTTAGTLTAVKLMDFDVKAEDGDVNISHISGTITASGCTSAECLASVELRDGSTILSSVTGADAFAFNDLDIDVSADSTKKLSVWGQVNPISADLLAGESVYAVVNDIDGTSGPSFTAVDIASTITGESQYFFRYAPAISFVSGSAANTGTDNKEGTYTLVFDVTAPSGSDIYVSKLVAISDTNGTNEVSKTAAFGGALSPSLSSTNTTASSGGATLGAKVTAGQTGRFTITGLVPVGGSAGFTGMQLDEVNWATTDDNTADFNQTWGFTDFKTPTVYVRAS